MGERLGVLTSRRLPKPPLGTGHLEERLEGVSCDCGVVEACWDKAELCRERSIDGEVDADPAGEDDVTLEDDRPLVKAVRLVAGACEVGIEEGVAAEGVLEANTPNRCNCDLVGIAEADRDTIGEGSKRWRNFDHPRASTKAFKGVPGWDKSVAVVGASLPSLSSPGEAAALEAGTITVSPSTGKSSPLANSTVAPHEGHCLPAT